MTSSSYNIHNQISQDNSKLLVIYQPQNKIIHSKKNNSAFVIGYNLNQIAQKTKNNKNIQQDLQNKLRSSSLQQIQFTNKAKQQLSELCKNKKINQIIYPINVNSKQGLQGDLTQTQSPKSRQSVSNFKLKHYQQGTITSVKAFTLLNNLIQNRPLLPQQNVNKIQQQSQNCIQNSKNCLTDKEIVQKQFENILKKNVSSNNDRMLLKREQQNNFSHNIMPKIKVNSSEVTFTQESVINRIKQSSRKPYLANQIIKVNKIKQKYLFLHKQQQQQQMISTNTNYNNFSTYRIQLASNFSSRKLSSYGQSFYNQEVQGQSLLGLPDINEMPYNFISQQHKLNQLLLQSNTNYYYDQELMLKKRNPYQQVRAINSLSQACKPDDNIDNSDLKLMINQVTFQNQVIRNQTSHKSLNAQHSNNNQNKQLKQNFFLQNGLPVSQKNKDDRLVAQFAATCNENSNRNLIISQVDCNTQQQSPSNYQQILSEDANKQKNSSKFQTWRQKQKKYYSQTQRSLLRPTKQQKEEQLKGWENDKSINSITEKDISEIIKEK